MYQPDYTAISGLFSHMDSEELKEILNDDDKFDTLLKDLKQVKDWEAEKETIMGSNRSLAEFNLSKEPELIEKRSNIQDLTVKGKELCCAVQELLTEIKNKSSNVSLDTTLALLQTAAAETEEESETIAEQYLSSQIEIEEFLEQFMVKRKQMHLRKFKADKMTELIRQKLPPNMGLGYNSYGNTPTPSYGNFGGSSVPYPVGAINMPMPGMYRQNHF